MHIGAGEGMSTVKAISSIRQSDDSIFSRLNVKPVINACGIYTDLGGSILSDSIWSDLTELNTAYADLIDLLDATGRAISELVHAEAARITPGVSAGLALAAAASMTGRRGDYWEQLPDTAGMRNEIILQRPQANSYKYINPVRLSGAQLIFAGSDQETILDDIRSVMTERTAAILIPAHLDNLANVVKLAELGEFSKAYNVRLLIDAAYQIYPPERMQSYAALGADLTMFSSKYYFGPNAGGFLSGTREMIDAVAGLDFTKYESGPYRTFGRAFKMGRYEIAAVYLALQEWFDMDHDERWRGYARMAGNIAQKLNQSSALTATTCCFTFDETIESEPANAVLVSPLHPTLSSQNLIDALKDENPAIYTVLYDNKILIVTETLRPGEDEYIVQRFLEIIEKLAAK